MQVVLAHSLIQLRDVISANLVTETARPGVNQNGDAILLEVVPGGSRLIENFINVLNFEKVVARAERSELAFSAELSAFAHHVGIRPGDAAALFGLVKVCFRAHSMVDCPARSLFENAVQIGVGSFEVTGLTGSGRNVAKQLMHQLTELRPHFVHFQRSAKQTHAAIDVETYAARRDHAVLLINGCNSADRKAVALMNVGHRQSAP